jgi:hypothetical protein
MLFRNLLDGIHDSMDYFSQGSEQDILDNITHKVPLIIEGNPEWKDGKPHILKSFINQDVENYGERVVASLPYLILLQINAYGDVKPGAEIARKAIPLLRSLGVTVSNEDEAKYVVSETPDIAEPIRDSGGRRKRRKTKQHKNKRKLRKTRKH